MKTNKILVLVLTALSIIITTDLRAQKNTKISNLSEKSKATKKEYERTYKQILKLEPTTWVGDVFGRDLLCGFIWSISRDTAEAICPDQLMENIDPALYLLIPVLQLGFDKYIRKTDELDNLLDILISEQILDKCGLVTAKIKLKKLEKKILQLSDKCEEFRWFVRGLIWLCIIGNILNSQAQPVVKVAVASTYTCLWWYCCAMQSATFKKTSRMEKFELFKALVKFAKKHHNITYPKNEA